MTKTAIFIPTKRHGGIDVTEASILRQTVHPAFIFICDELEREFYWNEIGRKIDVPVINIKTPYITSDKKRNLAQCYNLAVEYCLDYYVELLVSLQDYLWIPEDGLERFVKCYETNGDRYLYTGLTSISADPEEVFDLNAYYSIFETPYTQKPQQIEWEDVRLNWYRPWLENKAFILTTSDANHFEANWAAIPTLLFREGLRWDEDYDKGVACENNQLALDALVRYDCGIVLDTKNHAISLPHRKYFDEGEIGSDANKRNLEKYQKNWREALNAEKTT